MPVMWTFAGLAWAKGSLCSRLGVGRAEGLRGTPGGNPAPGWCWAATGERAESRSVRQETEREINKHMGLEESPSGG